MEVLNTLVIELVILAILAVFLELLIPAGDLSRYVRMVLGLLIIVAVLQAATGFWHRELAVDFGSLSLQPPTTTLGGNDVLEEGKRRWEESQAAALEGYRGGLARQIMALSRLNPEVEIEEVLVELDTEGVSGEIGSIRSITLLAAPVVDESDDVSVSLDLDGAWRESLERLCRTIAEFYNLEPDAVRYDDSRRRG